jgi:hypothetical protein
VHRGLRGVVIGVAAATSDQRIVFLAQDALTDAKFDGSHRISDYTLEAFHIAAVRRQAQTDNSGQMAWRAVGGFAALQQKAQASTGAWQPVAAIRLR